VRGLFALALLALAAASPAPPLGPVVDAAVAKGFEGVVLTGDAREVSFERAVGVADRATGRAHRVGDRWPWASVTKQVVATLVMQEVEQGRLTLETPLARALPAFKGPTAAQVTIRQLLQHVSGLPDPSATPEDANGVEAFYRTPLDPSAATGFCAGPGATAPSGKFLYNNCDYLVLGAVLERSSSKPLAQLIAERTRLPLTLPADAVGFPTPQRGYLDGSKPAPLVRLATFGAAGALIGRPRDLLAFDRALLANRLLTQPARDVLWKGDPKLGYEALGQWSFPAKLAGCAGPVQVIERQGDIAGIQVRNYIAPATGRILIVFTNRADVDFGQLWQGKGLGYDLASAAFCA